LLFNPFLTCCFPSSPYLLLFTHSLLVAFQPSPYFVSFHPLLTCSSSIPSLLVVLQSTC
jgi:hypothetical protein